VWAVRHRDELKKQCGQSYSPEEAADDFKNRYGKSVRNLFTKLWLMRSFER
jgi:hypothetical protein